MALHREGVGVGAGAGGAGTGGARGLGRLRSCGLLETAVRDVVSHRVRSFLWNLCSFSWEMKRWQPRIFQEYVSRTKKIILIGEVRFVITFTAFIRYSRTSARWRAMASNPFAGEPTFGTEPTYAPPGTTRTSMQSAQSEHSVPLTMSQPPVHVPPAKMGVLLFHILFKALALVVYMTNVSGQYVLTFVLVRSAELAQRRPLVVVRPCSLTAPCCFCRPDCLSRL